MAEERFGAAGNDTSKFIGALTALAGDETRAKQALGAAGTLGAGYLASRK